MPSAHAEWAPTAFSLHPIDESPIVYRGPSHQSDSGEVFTPMERRHPFNTEAE
jgi:hypothetical protein